MRARTSKVTRSAVALIRVSTTRERQALGVDAQREAIAAWAKREGVDIVAEHVEEVSGGAPLPDRSGLLAALADVDVLGAAYLVVAKLDRFSRDSMTAALATRELERHDAKLAVADGAGEGTDPTSKMVQQILLAVGQFERAMIGARIRAALAVKQSRGELTGKAPYGMRVVDGPMRMGKDGVSGVVAMLEPDDGEQAIIARIRGLREQHSIREIAAILEREGVVGRAGRPLTRDAVHRVLTSASAA